MEMPMQLWRPEFELDGINSVSWYQCLPIRIRIYHWQWEGHCTAVVRSRMLHGSETWPIRKENQVALQWVEMKMVRWMCSIKLQDRVPSNGDERETRIKWHTFGTTARHRCTYGHVLRKEDSDWAKKCMEYEVEGTRSRGRPKKTWESLWKKTVRQVNWTRRMLWIIIDGGSR